MKLTVAFLFCVVSFSVTHAQNNVGIGTANPDPSSILELQSDNKGILIPRMTSTQRQAINNPQNGLLVFDTDTGCFFFYKAISAQWLNLCQGGGGGAVGSVGPTGLDGATGPTGPTGSDWDLSSSSFNSNGALTINTTKPSSIMSTNAAWLTMGNNATTAGTNFIGTTDNQAFLVKTNGPAAANERLRFTATPQIVVNGTVPNNKTLTTIYGTGAAGALNSIPGQTDNPLTCFSTDTFKSVVGSNDANGTGVYGENLSNNPTRGSGVWGYGKNIVGVIGITDDNIGVSSAATLGWSRANIGTGTAGLGNNHPFYFVLSQGSGGSFSGKEIGIFSYAFGAPSIFGNTAGGYFKDSISPASVSTAYVAAYIGGTNYKVYGNGAVSTTVRDLQEKPVIMYAPESPEVIFQDYGTAKLINGHTIVKLDPIFSKNIFVDEPHPLRVIIQPEGECNQLYVTNKTRDGFEVKEMNNGSSNINFTYFVAGNRADEIVNGQISSLYQNNRFPRAPEDPTIHAVPIPVGHGNR